MEKVIVISGGSDGLGYETAKILAAGNKVVVLSPEEDKLKQVAAELACDFEICDVSDAANVESAVKNIIGRRGKIDCLINNAGIFMEGELASGDPERMKKVLEVNTLGVMLLSRAVIPFMKQAGDGLIVNVISQAGLYGRPERSVYNASKFAVTGFTKSLQMELPKYGIRVTGIYPGKTKTGMFQKMGIPKDLSDAIDPREVAKTIEFVVAQSDVTVIPEIGIKHIKNL